MSLTALYPPTTSVAFASPNSCKLLAARELVYPSLHSTIARTSHLRPQGKLSLAAEDGSRRHSSTLRSIAMAPRMVPSHCACSGGRMSISTAGGDWGDDEVKMWCAALAESRCRCERASSSISSMLLDNCGAMVGSRPENLSFGISISWLGGEDILEARSWSRGDACSAT